MKTYEPMAGENVNTTAHEMVTLAMKTRDTVKAKFNGIELTATSNSTADGIVAYYGEESKRRSEMYRNSPEGKKAIQENEERKVAMQKKHDALMQQLPSLDFTNDVAVLDWFTQFQAPSEHIGVGKQLSVVLTTFASHGYHPNVNTGKDFDVNDRDNFARYVIGQALAGLACEVGAIHKVFHKFADDWKKKFLAA